MQGAAEVFIIKLFPELRVCQLPSIKLDSGRFIDYIRDGKTEYVIFSDVSKDYIEHVLLHLGFKNLIILKLAYDYLFINTTMMELLEMANRSRRIHDLRAFW